MRFGGFPKETAAFLKGIAEHNDKEWFTVNRALYDAGYVEAAKAFIEAMGPELRQISPTVNYEARIGGSMMRVNRDTRFSKDKRPYKDHLDVWFWHGAEKGWEQPGFFMRITPAVLWVGAGMHHMEGGLLTRFRDAIVDDRSGKSLSATIKKVEAAGDYQVGYPSRKQVPRGYDRTHPRAELLLYESLYAHRQMPMEAALAADFGDVALTAFGKTWPIAKWLLDEAVE